MGRRRETELEELWARHSAEWRDPAQISSQWEEAGRTDPALLRGRARGGWWKAIERCRATLIVSREYEHMLMAMSVRGGRPLTSFMRLPHPSGVAVDRDRGLVHVASTRNPNQVYDLAPATSALRRGDAPDGRVDGSPLVPVRSRFYPGCLYMHDLAMVGGMLHANAVGENAVVRLDPGGGHRRVWWPACIERRARPDFSRNHIQLNSIAAGANVRASYFSASAERISSRRPGHLNFPVDRRGVIFSGATREPVARGLTRPHSARLLSGRLWVANSGYGELGVVEDGAYEPVLRLPGWTRGLAFCGDVAFVGTSRVIPRFRAYAPGLDVDRSVCGVHAVDTGSGRLLGSLVWPRGNQVFGIDWLPRTVSAGFPFKAAGRQDARVKSLFYSFSTPLSDRGDP